jgi:hypothetical protein
MFHLAALRKTIPGYVPRILRKMDEGSNAFLTHRPLTGFGAEPGQPASNRIAIKAIEEETR